MTTKNNLHEDFRLAHSALEAARENVKAMTLALAEMRTDLYDKQQELLARQDEDAQFLSKAIIGKADRGLCVRCGESLGKGTWPMCIRCTSRSKERVSAVEIATAAISGSNRNLILAESEVEKCRLAEVTAFESWAKEQYTQAAEELVDLLRKAFVLSTRTDAIAQIAETRRGRDYGLMGRGGLALRLGESHRVQAAIINLRQNNVAPTEEKAQKKSYDQLRIDAKEKVCAECFLPAPAGERPAPNYALMDKVGLPRMQKREHITGGKSSSGAGGV